MIIYVWEDGSWIYDWEVNGFTMKHHTEPVGGRWIDLDKLYGIHPKLTDNEVKAIAEALGE